MAGQQHRVNTKEALLKNALFQINKYRESCIRHSPTARFISCGITINFYSSNKALHDVCVDGFFKQKDSDHEGHSCDIYTATSEQMNLDLNSFLESGCSTVKGTRQTGYLTKYQNQTFLFQLTDTGLSVNYFDSVRNFGFYWTSDLELTINSQAGSPLLPILFWMAVVDEKYIWHAAALSDGDGCVLIGGAAGHGKSTLAVQGIEAGLHYMGDDSVAVCPRSLKAAAVYRSIKLDRRFVLPEKSRKFFHMTSLKNTNKAVYAFEPKTKCVAGKFRAVKAVLIADYNEADITRITEINKAEAYRHLAPSTLFQFPGSGQRELAAIKKILLSVPVYKITSSYRSINAGDVLAGCFKGASFESKKC